MEARAAAKLREKKCDVMVANDVSAPGIGFGAEDNAVTVLFSDGARVEIPRAPKSAVAERLWTLLAPRLGARAPAPAAGAEASVHVLPPRAPRSSRGKNS
jgi:phosphopantothenoylcysteine decarboxylase/phosphopantothenate--cysteine ligase